MHHEQSVPPTCKTGNWPACSEALKQRGPPTIWFDPEMSWDATPSGRLGRQQTYGSAAIPACLALKVLFSMVPRQTTGVVESLLRLVGLDRTVPGFGTRSRRQETLAATIPCRGSKGPLHLLIDGTGIKVEGEWRARKHGGPERRARHCPRSNGGHGSRSKIHLGIDGQTLEGRAVEITGSHIGDAPVLPDLPDQIPADGEIGSVTAELPADAPPVRAPLATPMIPENAMVQSPIVASMPSSRSSASAGRPGRRR